MHNSLPRYLGSLGLLAVVVAAFLRLSRPEMVLDLVGDIDVRWALGGMSLFLVGHLLRALRLSALLEGSEIPLTRLFCWSGLHAVWTYVLPARTGEVMLAVYLRRYENQPPSRGLALVFFVRSLEAAWVLLLVPYVLFTFRHTWQFAWKWSLAIGAMGAIVACLWILYFRVLPAFSKREKSTFFARTLTRVYEFAEGLRGHYRTFMGIKRWPLVAVLTLCIWSFNLAVFYSMFEMFHVEIPISNVVLLSIGMSAVQILPLKAFGNIGPHEVIWVPVLSLSGLGLGSAISMAAATHVVYLVYVAIFGVLLAVLRHVVTAGVSVCPSLRFVRSPSRTTTNIESRR